MSLKTFLRAPLDRLNRWRFDRINQKRRDPVLRLPLGYATQAAQPSGRVAVLLHAYYTEDLLEFQRALKNLGFPFALFISTDTEAKQAIIATVFAEWTPDIKLMPNRGRDVAPKFVGFRAIYADYDFVLHLHTKKSDHTAGLDVWRPFLLSCLLGSPEIVANIFEIFGQCPQLGVIAPRNFGWIRQYMVWGENFDNCRRLAKSMGLRLKPYAPLDFPAGSMFWARTSALRPLLALNLHLDDFAEERGQIDGTLAHAIERMIFYSCETAGYQWIHVGRVDAPEPFEKVIHIASRAELGKVLAEAADTLLPHAPHRDLKALK
jgi:lipopolysaccharide biosynthesis protein